MDKASATGETKRRRQMPPDQRVQEQLGGKSRTCSWLDPKVSEVDHFTSHSRCKGFCIRCDLYRNRKDYDACATMENKHNKQSWLKTGARRGVWGMGCRLCAAFAATGAHIGSRCSKFAMFQVRPSSGWRARLALLQHARSASHRRACAFGGVQPLARPPKVRQEAPSSRGICPADDALDGKVPELLRGNVPSASDWQDAWSVASELTSLRCEGRVMEKRTSATGERLLHKRRKRIRNQMQIMAEVIRQNIRSTLAKATNITLAVDEAQHRKIVRFRADSSEPLARDCFFGKVSAGNYSISGVLGVLHCSKKHACDFEDDHAVTAVKQLDGFMTRFCTPLGPSVRGGRQRGPQPLACDVMLKAEIMKKVTCFAADGASKERRALALAVREVFPNVLIVIRDPAHAIRIASKSLHCDALFGEVWDELFDGRHALAPDLMNSDKWHSLLVAIQEDNAALMAAPGQAQPMARVLRNLAFAKQRFDSTASPVAKIALMFLPVATLLSYIASDRRHEKEQRDKAVSLLKKLDSKFCTATGVSADWGIIVVGFAPF